MYTLPPSSVDINALKLQNYDVSTETIYPFLSVPKPRRNGCRQTVLDSLKRLQSGPKLPRFQAAVLSHLGINSIRSLRRLVSRKLPCRTCRSLAFGAACYTLPVSYHSVVIAVMALFVHSKRVYSTLRFCVCLPVAVKLKLNTLQVSQI